MPKYKYKTLNSLGKIIQGTLEASSEESLANTLRQKRLQVLSISRAGILNSLKDHWARRNEKVTARSIKIIKNADLHEMTRGLSGF